jgi:SAM-dependent methyltransferase
MNAQALHNRNIDARTVEGFGAQWARLDQSPVPPDELEATFASYFDIFPWNSLPPDAVGFDLGCGSGRWARLVAERVGTLHCIEPSRPALAVAERNLADKPNCRFHPAGLDDMPVPDNSMDFGYVLGVFHYVPDPAEGLKACVRKLKPGAPLLVYMYYALENRPAWYRCMWKTTDLVRRIVSRLPFGLRYFVTQAMAAGVYFPLARTAWLLERIGLNVRNLPLAAYRNRSFYTMRTDALDRFGNRLEHRFSATEIGAMMQEAGLERIVFSKSSFWSVLGYKSGAR